MNGELSVLSYGVDITDRKENEERLRSSEEQYRLLFEEGLTAANYVTTEDGILQMCNSSFAKILGYDSAEQLLYKNTSEFYLDPDDLKYLISQVKKNKKAELYEVELVRKDNSTIWVLANNYGTFDKHGNLLYLNGYMFNVTSRKKASLDLLQTQAKLSAIIESSADDIWSVDKNYNLLEFNYSYFKRTNDITGCKPYIGMPLDQRVNPHKEGSWKTWYERALSGESFTVEIEEVVQGQKIYFDVSFSPIRTAKEISGAAIIARDITERKKMEKRMEAKVNDLNTFMYKASHDLRAPLSSLLGLIALAKKNALNDEQVLYFKMIDESTRKMDKILMDLVDIAKITQGTLQTQTVDFKKTINEVIDRLNKTSGFGEMMIETEFSLNYFFHSDERILQSVFQNLIENSFKYRNKKVKGLIHIMAKTIATGAIVAISDNGVGIAKEHLPKVSDMFFRASEKSSGTGLGLYIVKTSIEKLGGTVSIVSELEKGTTVRLFIPDKKK